MEDEIKEEENKEEEKCRFCEEHEQGDTLYDAMGWDGGIDYQYVRPIKYCPLCGKELVKERY